MGGREVLAFDLYGTLVDPIAIAGELGRLLGESVGAEAAVLWRGKQLEYSFRLTAMGRYEDFRWVTARALDFALASVGARLPAGEVFGRRISVDEVRVFKPSPVVYRHAAGQLSARPGRSGWSPATRSTVSGPAPPGCAPPG